jgi:type III pantothenate kinase
MPSSVGGDLICASVAANKLYGSPSLIVDIDTATKMTLVNSDGAFAGTSILPGVLMGLEALSSGAALLPTVELSAPDKVIGKNTADCMRSGIIYGTAGAIDGLLDRMEAALGTPPASIVATGGMSGLITPHRHHGLLTDETLVLKGLSIIWTKNQK